MAENCKNIGKKILAVMNAMGAISKDKKNSFHGYMYVSDEAIVTKLREAVIANNLVILPSQKSCVITEQKNVKGEISFLTTLEVEYTLIDADSGETFVSRVFGYGKDKEDKGVYKAATGAEKYFLLKTFLIPTSDDPEASEAPRETRKPEPRAAAQQPAPRSTWKPDASQISFDEQKTLFALIKEHNIKLEDFKKFLTDDLKVLGTNHIKKSQYNLAYEWILKNSKPKDEKPKTEKPAYTEANQ